MAWLRRGKWVIFVLVAITVGATFEPEEAEARRGGFFRRVFGGRGRPGVSRNVRRRGGQRRPSARNNNLNRNFARHNFNNFDTDVLGRFAVDDFSSLLIDPTGSLSRVNGTQNIAVDRFGNLFEVDFTGGALLQVRQPLLRINGQIRGGLVHGTVLDSTRSDIIFLNSLGNRDF